MRSLTTLLLVWVCTSLFAQVNYTANNLIKPYTGDLRAAAQASNQALVTKYALSASPNPFSDILEPPKRGLF